MERFTLLPSFVFLPLLALALATGCANESGLRVSGAATVTEGDARSEFRFPGERLLVDDLAEAADGRIAGHCLMDGDTVDLGLSRSATEGDALSSISLTLPAPSGTETAVISATLGDTSFVGESGVDCLIEEMYRQREDGLVGATAVCTLKDATGRTAEVDLELMYAGCTSK